MAGTASALIWLKGHQRLGKPGIKAIPIPGSTMMKIDLPERVPDFTSTNVPESEVELVIFQKTPVMPGVSIRQPMVWGQHHRHFDGRRPHEHSPAGILPAGQGWSIDKKTEVKIPIDGAPHYELPVMKWVISKWSQPRRSETGNQRVYVFWFVADNEEVTGNVQLQCQLVKTFYAPGCCNAGLYFLFCRLRTGSGRRRV